MLLHFFVILCALVTSPMGIPAGGGYFPGRERSSFVFLPPSKGSPRPAERHPDPKLHEFQILSMAKYLDYLHWWCFSGVISLKKISFYETEAIFRSSLMNNAQIVQTFAWIVLTLSMSLYLYCLGLIHSFAYHSNH